MQSFNPKPLDNADPKKATRFEVECMQCRWTFIMQIGDKMIIHVGESGDVDGVVCPTCSKK